MRIIKQFYSIAVTSVQLLEFYYNALTKGWYLSLDYLTGIYMSHMGRACTNVYACLNSLINGFYCCDCIIFDVLFDKDII